MTQLVARISSEADTNRATHELLEVFSSQAAPQIVFAFYGECHNDVVVLERFAECLPDTPLIGGTSSGGIIGAGRLPGPTDIGLLAIYDPGGDYGVGSAHIGEDARAAGREAVQTALRNCDCEGIVPSLVWVFQPPGNEESVLRGIQDVIENRCPVVGGSAGDDAVAGNWRQLSKEGASATTVSVAVLFPSSAISTVFQSGYAPAGRNGIVTESRGRTIVSIDAEPAAQIYDQWRGGGVREAQTEEGSILAASALAPLGVPSRSVAGITQHRLVHPALINDDGSLEVFATVDVGEQIELMSGSPDSLASRAGRVLEDAVAMLPAPDSFAGALLIYCGGCAMSLGDRMSTMTAAVENAGRGQPIIGAFTFGEQGVLGDDSVHGNLMVSAVAFGGRSVA